MKILLKPCPHCGNNPRYTEDIDGKFASISCCSSMTADLHILGREDGVKSLAERWNRRSVSPVDLGWIMRKAISIPHDEFIKTLKSEGISEDNAEMIYRRTRTKSGMAHILTGTREFSRPILKAVDQIQEDENS